METIASVVGVVFLIDAFEFEKPKMSFGENVCVGNAKSVLIGVVSGKVVIGYSGAC